MTEITISRLDVFQQEFMKHEHELSLCYHVHVLLIDLSQQLVNIHRKNVCVEKRKAVTAKAQVTDILVMK